MKSLILLLITIFLLPIVSLAQLDALSKVQNTLTSADKIVSNTSALVAQIDAKVQQVENHNLYKALVDGKEFSFPIGILPGSGDKKYALILNSVFMTPEGMFAEIFMKIPVGANRSLYFIADKVPFSRSGGIAGDLRLYLLKTDSLQVGKGFTIQFDGLEKGGIEKSCFVTFNCKGFKDITLSGAVNFNKESIVKDKKSQEQVSVKYYVQADKLTNFIITLNDIPTFEFKNLPGFTCSVPTIVLDKSEIRNSPDFSLPSWYTDSLRKMPGLANVEVGGVDWEGLYIPEITINIPKAFTEDNPNAAVVIKSRDFIIDQNGVTGKNSVEHLLDGKIKGWEYSIDSLRVNLIASSLSKAAIYGDISLPVSSKETTIGYSLLMTKPIASNDIDYAGSLDIEREGGLLNAQAMGVAKFKLNKASFEFEYTNDQFYPAVVIEDGSLNLGVNKEDSDQSFASFGLSISKLRISSRAPYINLEKHGFVKMSGSGNAMANFPVSIDTVGIINGDGGQRVGLFMTLAVKLQKTGGDSEGSNGFEGKASFTVWTKRNAVEKRWAYDGFKLDEIIVDVDNSSFSLYGRIKTFDTETEKGFCGHLDMKVLDKIGVQASAIFGRKGQVPIDLDNPPSDEDLDDSDSDYRFWYVDAAVTFPVLPVAGFIGVNGFTGGLYHHMKMSKDGSTSSSATADCSTSSGLSFSPSKDIFLGLMAGVGIQSVPTSAVFNGKINLGLEFNDNGGLNMVAFWGGVTLLTPEFKVPGTSDIMGKMEPQDTIKKADLKSKVPKEEEGNLRVTWFTEYNVPNKTFIGDFDIYMNFAGVINGSGDAYKAGHIAVMFSPDKDYVYVGTPVDPISVEVVKLFECSSYFCAGNVLPNPPIAPLPKEVKGADKLDYSTLETGAGLSFGARVAVDGKFGAKFNIGCKGWVGAELWAKAGFDVLISKSNKPVYCGGSSEARGINNWYATGQTFIAGGFRLGVDYDCLLASGSANLISANISAFLFAQLPKPSYLTGNVNIDFKVIGIGCSADIPIEFGEKCQKAVLDKSIVFISSVTPDSSTQGVSVASSIKIFFEKPIEKFEFMLPDETNPDGGTVPYRAYVEDSYVTVTCNNSIVECKYDWNSSRTVLTLSPKKVLPEKSLVRVDVKVQLQYDKGGWKESSTAELKTVIFETELEPVKIPNSNIVYSYPLPEMKNYYRMEYNTGYVNLNTLPVKPFHLSPGWTFNAVFEEGGTEVARVKEVTVNNSIGSEQFTYLIPNDKLQNGKRYKFKIVKAPLETHEKENQDKEYTVGYIAETPKDTIVIEYDFTVSRFSSFSQKIAYYNQSKVEVSGASVVQTLKPNQKDIDDGNTETFTDDESIGYSQKVRPLIQSLGADFSNGFAISGSGIPDTVSFSCYSNNLVINYEVFDQIEKNNKDKSAKAILCTIDGNSANCSNTSGSKSVTFPKAKYYYKLGYFVPGRDQKTSEVSMSFDLPEPVIAGI